MLTIRLTRVGKKKDGSFRVVVVESKRKVQAGNYLEMVGSYDPRVDKVELKADRIKHWIGMGATVSDTVHNLLISQNVIEGKKINVLPKKTVPKKEEPAAEAPALEKAEEQSDATPQRDADTDGSSEKEQTTAPEASQEGDSAVAEEAKAE